MDFMVKMARFQIKQNVLNLKSTLLESLKIHVCILVQCAVHNKDHQNDEKVLNLTASVK